MAETKRDDASGCTGRSSSRASFSRARVVDATAVVVFVALSVLSRGALASASAVKTRTRTSTTATSPARDELSTTNKDHNLVRLTRIIT